MNERTRQLYHDSLSRCWRNTAFIVSFYERFMSVSPEIRQMFAATDFVKQRRMMKTALYGLAHHDEDAGAHFELLESAKVHVTRGITPEMYRIWLETLLETVRAFDYALDAETETAWRVVLQSGVDFYENAVG